jgi:hypothetical protein
LEVRVSDGGSGVDPKSLVVHIDGEERPASYTNGLVRIPVKGLARGRHAVSVSAADYQEAKNNENVRGILPNTRRVQRAFVIP